MYVGVFIVILFMMVVVMFMFGRKLDKIVGICLFLVGYGIIIIEYVYLSLSLINKNIYLYSLCILIYFVIIYLLIIYTMGQAYC